MNYKAISKISGAVGAMLGFSFAVVAQSSLPAPTTGIASVTTSNGVSVVATPVPLPGRPPAPAPIVMLPPGILAFDAENKEFTSQPGETKFNFSFYLTNVSPAEITVTDVKGTCFCTVAQLPVPLPWKVPPGGGGPVPFILDLVGKSGTLYKTVTVQTDKGLKSLSVKVNVTPAPPVPMTEADREKNQALMKADRQLIFKGDCAKCHVEPVIGKTGKDLYATACGICHEAEHRATMVPDLHNLPNDTNAEYWKLMATVGKPNTLMPAFSQTQGGPLSDMQVTSLVEYLVATMPAKGTNSRPIITPAKH